MDVDTDGQREINALGNAKITFAQVGVGGGWVCATGINGAVVYELLDGLVRRQVRVCAEDVTPTVHADQVVAAGQEIGTFPAEWL